MEQAVRYKVRYTRFLFGDTTTDVDCQNCHPKILQWICKKYAIPCPYLDYYNNNREDVLMSGDRNEIKIVILKMVNDDKPNRGLKDYLKNLDKERKEIQKQITAREEYADLMKTNTPT